MQTQVVVLNKSSVAMSVILNPYHSGQFKKGKQQKENAQEKMQRIGEQKFGLDCSYVLFGKFCHKNGVKLSVTWNCHQGSFGG